MRREGRIPHRRGCYEMVKGLDGITGELVETTVTNYSKLEPKDARSNASKIRYPATLFHCGKAYSPREKSMGKIKGECKRRDKDCVADMRLSDAALVDPEHPSSWKAREIASRLAESEELAIPPHVFDSDAASDSSGSSSGPFRAPRATKTRVYSSTRMSLIDVLRASSPSEWPSISGAPAASAPREVPSVGAGLRRKARKRVLRTGSLRYSSSPVPERSDGLGGPCVRLSLPPGGSPGAQKHRLGAVDVGGEDAPAEDCPMGVSPSDISSLCNLNLDSGSLRSLPGNIDVAAARVDAAAATPPPASEPVAVCPVDDEDLDEQAAVSIGDESSDEERMEGAEHGVEEEDWDMVSLSDDSEDWDVISGGDHGA